MRLFEDHTPLALTIAGGFKRRLPSHIAFDDVRAAAMGGLWDAVRKNPDCGHFPQYASMRIKGAIRDDLRTKDWMSRASRKRGDGLRVFLTEELPSVASDYDIEAHVDAARDLAAVMSALSLLPDRMRHIVVSHHMEGRDLRSIGAELGISEPRVCQIKMEGLSRLRGLASSLPPE